MQNDQINPTHQGLVQNNPNNTDYFSRFFKSPILKAFGLFILIVLMFIPLELIEETIENRATYRDEARRSIAESWGSEQSLIPGMLILPYRVWENIKDDKGTVTREARWYYYMILPEKLELKATDKIDVRRRGIFEMPLYTQNMKIKGVFKTDVLHHVPDSDIKWESAQFVLGVSHLRGLQSGLLLNFNQTSVAFSPGAGELNSIVNAESVQNKQFIHTNITAQKGENQFDFNVVFRGSQRLSIAPIGKNNDIQLNSHWPHPSFTGDWLPNHDITKDGFTAQWLIPDLSRPYAQSSVLSSEYLANIQAHQLSVNFNVPVDGYKMSLRTAKYGILFILLTFALYFLMEILGRAKIHIFQYILVGLGLSLFYLLQIALTEQMDFIFAYLIASLAIVMQVGLYSTSVLKSYKYGAIIGIAMGLLYVYLYTLLEAEDYALLSASIGLFVILSAIMAATRNIDWHNLGKKSA